MPSKFFIIGCLGGSMGSWCSEIKKEAIASLKYQEYVSKYI